ncbi:MAG: polysaccharide biosynthesis tyrosine autokinase [Deltaproteobacteria bacterium]|nr:polysaccharide biosynthesis tyrosine autokinase [Deltaproteobacteria bacterium]
MPSSSDALGNSAAPHEAIAQLVRLLGVLRRRWLLWVAATGLCVAAAGLALRFVPARYQATASLVLHQGGPQVLDKVRGVSEEGQEQGKDYDAYYQTQRGIMRSRAVAERALAGLGLADDPDALRDADGPLMSAPPSADAVERLQRLMTIREIRGSRIVEVTAEHPNPETARDLANALADAYLGHVRNSRRNLGRLAEDNLAQERRTARARLREAEAALQQFKDDNNVTSVSLADRQNVITQDVLSLSARAKEAEAEHIHMGSVLTQAEKHHQRGDLLAALLVLADGEPTLDRLRVEHLTAKAAYRSADIEFGPKHALHREAKQRLSQAERDLRREVDARLASLRSRVDAARSTEGRLDQSLVREHSRAVALGSIEQRHQELARDAKTAEEEYLLIARRDTEVSLTNRVEAEGIELLDRATEPATAAFPHRGLGLALGATVGLALGFLLALVVDARDQRIRDAQDLERALGEDAPPVLGQLPALRGDPALRRGDSHEQRRTRDLYVHRFPASLMAERCRGIRTSLAFVQGTSALRCMMVTSPGPSEGKSSVALSLAISLCQADKKVVLVDADMRRPRLHTAFVGRGAPAPTLGLAPVLLGNASLDDAIIPSPNGAPDNLDIIPCGDPPEHPAELLESTALTDLVDELRARYDVVIIDSPPVLPVADPLILAQKVDGVVLVPRVGRTTRGQLTRTAMLLRQADARGLGIVLNEVDTRRDDPYGGSSYGYTADERSRVVGDVNAA